MPGPTSSYPTEEELASTLHEPAKGELNRLLQWKAEDWNEARKEDNRQRFLSIRRLLLSFAESDGLPLNDVLWEPAAENNGNYDRNSNTVTLYGNPSIITALHELGHRLYGDSELQACSWSVSLFRAAFPKAWKGLKSDGHRFVRA